MREDNTTYFLHTDHLGSINVITDLAGEKVSLTEYTPYGMTSKEENDPSYTEPRTPYKFTGQEQDSSAGLYYYNARYYDPELGRFIQADSIVQAPYDPQTLNRYAYCRNNPVKFVDPSGHGWFSAFLGFVGAIVGGPVNDNI